MDVRSVQDFEMIKMIGKGSCEVMLVEEGHENVVCHENSGQKNIIRRNQVEHTIGKSLVQNQTSVHRDTSHAFQTGKKLYFVLDYCSGGELFFHLGRCGRLRESLVFTLLRSHSRCHTFTVWVLRVEI